MLKILKFIAIGVFVFVISPIKSQNTMQYTHEDADYKLGKELFDKEKFVQAQFYFENVIQYYGAEHTDVKANAEYYSALCAIALFNEDAEYRIAQFIAKYPESPLTRIAYFDMAKFQYQKKEYEKALYYFKKVWKQHLTTDQLHEYYFKLGYAYFKLEDFENASKKFYEIISIDSKFKAPANYFYAHIAYTDGNYETALKHFKIIEEDPSFSPVVPYYVIQIYYLQGKNDEVLAYGPDLLAKVKSKREAEIARLVGEALYKKGQLQEALPYLEIYKQKSENYTREDIYQLGYIYYMNNDLENAISTFSNVTNAQDALSQNAYFHLADCYIKLGKLEQAMMAFDAASKMDFDGEIKEVALLNYAKLSYELSYSPFNETINAFYNYVTSYPNSIHHDEAYSYLVKVYMTSKNYKEALESLRKIKTKTPEMMAAHQRVAYFRGLELYNNLKFEEAFAAFDESTNQRIFDKQLNALGIYWKAEALYRLEKYQESYNSFNAFIHKPGAYSLEEFNNTYYNMGYCQFKLENYEQATISFRNYTDKTKEVNQIKRGDALIRVGDCYFMMRQYKAAIEYYNRAVKLDTFDVDYALFQLGFSYGLVKQNSLKVKTLSQLINKKQSAYKVDALYERGRSFVMTDSIGKALNDFDQLIVEFPNSTYVVKALLQLGLLHYGQDNYEDALLAYKKVVNDFPGTVEANDALMGIKNIYVDMNKVDDYFAYAEQKGGIEDISITEKDSLTYLAAEKIYMTGKWSMSTKLFNNYIGKFPSGKFIVNAHYYRGDCYVRDQMKDSALADFTFVISKPINIFTEQSLVYSAEINQNQGNDSLAYVLFKQLENQAEVKGNLLIARLGQMRSAFKDSVYDNAVEAARRVLITDKVFEEEVREARMIMAKSFLAQGLPDVAITQFRILALDVANIEGAEGKYQVANILFKQNDLVLAEKEIVDFIGLGTPHQYWLAKAFLLLSDIYVKNEDSFQAKANLQSVIDNYGIETDGIVDEAKAKLEAIVMVENEKFQSEDEQLAPAPAIDGAQDLNTEQDEQPIENDENTQDEE